MMQQTLSIQFAPLQGYTETVYRNAHEAVFGGADIYYTPFVRVEKETFRPKDVRDISPEKNRVYRLIPQLIAPTPEKAEAVLGLFIEKGYREADLNLGCPFPLLAKRHNGSGILPYPDEVRELLRIIRRHPEINFSVKMRLGWEDPKECLALADLLNEIPLRQVTMHARIGMQQYKGKPDMEGFRTFYEVCRHPLVYNGDITDTADIRHLSTLFPHLAGVMIGRGLLARPALALEYKESRTLGEDEYWERMKALHTAVFEGYASQLEGGDAQLLNKMKTFWEYPSAGIDRKAAKSIRKSTSLSKYEQAVSTFFNQPLHR